MLSFSEKQLQACLTPGCTAACVLKSQLLNIDMKYIRLQNTSAYIYVRTAELLPFIAVKTVLYFSGQKMEKTKIDYFWESLNDGWFLSSSVGGQFLCSLALCDSEDKINKLPIGKLLQDWTECELCAGWMLFKFPLPDSKQISAEVVSEQRRGWEQGSRKFKTVNKLWAGEAVQRSQKSAGACLAEPSPQEGAELRTEEQWQKRRAYLHHSPFPAAV